MADKTEPFEEKMVKSIKNLENELSTIRVGRANPHVLDKLTVDYHGTVTPLTHVGNISVPEARLLQITPWEPAMLKVIEKAIQASDLGINPTNDGKVVRLVFPELTEERRKQLGKDVKKMGDDCKVAIRNIRRDAVDSFKKQEKKSEITEDELKKLEDTIQKLTDKKTEEIDKVVEAKTKEIMSL
ncbi:MAG: ribosome recycling factor [Clostridiales bacterium]|jgi:ribosome recycling factor|nr:ribosome recycling factor [Clostridiales bacterium]